MKDSKDKEKNKKPLPETEIVDTLGHNCKHKCQWHRLILIVLIVLVSTLSAYYLFRDNCLDLIKKNQQEIAKEIEEDYRLYCDSNLDKMNSKLSTLRDELSTLKNELSKREVENEKVIVAEVIENKKNEMRKKWKIWTALKSKMEANEPFYKELEEFNSAFAYDQELIEMVKDLAKGMDVICRANSDKSDAIGVCKRYLKKIICVKKIDYKKLLEVSGYVLSSVNDN